MSKTARLVRERVDPRLTAALFAKVDNAIDFAGAGRPLEVDLSPRPGALVITVTGGSA